MGLFFLIFGVVLVLIGVAFLVLGPLVAKKQEELEQSCTVSAEAELIDIERRSESWMDEIEVTYHGIYTFVTSNGRHVEAVNEVGHGVSDDVPGPTVTILYNPNNPHEFIVPEEQVRIAEVKVVPSLRPVGIGALVIGVPLLIAAAVFWSA